MSETNLSTEKFYRDTISASEASPGAASVAGQARGKICERVASHTSLLVGGIMLVCVGFVAVGMYSSAKGRVDARAKHSNHTLDWLLWFGGAKDDQTFEKFITDGIARSEREWEDKFRDSPMYQFEGKKIDFKNGPWKVEPLQFNQPSGRRSR